MYVGFVHYGFVTLRKNYPRLFMEHVKERPPSLRNFQPESALKRKWQKRRQMIYLE